MFVTVFVTVFLTVFFTVENTDIPGEDAIRSYRLLLDPKFSITYPAKIVAPIFLRTGLFGNLLGGFSIGKESPRRWGLDLSGATSRNIYKMSRQRHANVMQ